MCSLALLVLHREHLAEHHGALFHALLTNWQKQRDGGVCAKPSRGRQEPQHTRPAARTRENGRGRRRTARHPAGKESLTHHPRLTERGSRATHIYSVRLIFCVPLIV